MSHDIPHPSSWFQAEAAPSRYTMCFVCTRDPLGWNGKHRKHSTKPWNDGQMIGPTTRDVLDVYLAANQRAQLRQARSLFAAAALYSAPCALTCRCPRRARRHPVHGPARGALPSFRRVVSRVRRQPRNGRPRRGRHHRRPRGHVGGGRSRLPTLAHNEGCA
jgi:hypothetical protein